MTDVTLHYVHDPLCGWCYAVAPMVQAVRDAGIAIVLHGGGLWDPPTRPHPDKSGYIRENDGRIAALTGQAFGPAYLDSLLDDPETVLWSEPTIAAVLAAEASRPGLGLPMLHAIQEAHYVAGRRVVERPVLVDIAGGVGAKGDAFLQGLDHGDAAAHIRRTREWMGRLGMRGFPSFALERAGALVRVQHEPFYGRPDAFVQAVREIAAKAAAA